MSNEFRKYELEIDGTTVDATIFYNKNKPCAVVLDESSKNTGASLNTVSDKAMLHSANAIRDTHKSMSGGDKLYVFANNGNETYKQQPFELEMKGSIYDQSAKEPMMSPYKKNNGTDHQPLDAVHKDRVNYTISELQGKNSLAENRLPSMNKGQEQDLLQKR